MDHSLLIQVGDKPHMLAKVLKFVGPWLSWGDWQNVEMLNKAINKWCQSEDATMSLFVSRFLFFSQYVTLPTANLCVYFFSLLSRLTHRS